MSGNADFIAFTSPCGGVGTSGLAVAAGRILSRLGGLRVLYMGFDRLSAKCGPDGGAPLSDFFKALVLDCNWSSFMEKAVVTDEYELGYLKCREALNPLCADLDRPELFLGKISEEYDAVILDIPFCASVMKEILSLCEHIVLCRASARPSDSGCTDTAERIFKDCFPHAALHGFSCFRDEFSFADGSPDIHGEYGAHVRELLAEIKLGTVRLSGDAVCCP